MISASARESWLSEQARSSQKGSDDQLSWLLTAATLLPTNLEANINLFRVLRSQNRSVIAAKLLGNLIAKYSSTEIVAAELKALADDADDERYVNLAATAPEHEAEKLEKEHLLARSIVSSLPADIQAVVKLKAVGTGGPGNLLKRAEILHAALTDSFNTSPSAFSDAFVSLACADLLERLLSGSSRELRHRLCDKVLPALLRSKNAEPSPHPVLSRLPNGLVLRCLNVYIGHVLLAAFNSSTASLMSIDRHWQPCLILVNRVLFSSLNLQFSSFLSSEDISSPSPQLSLDQLVECFLRIPERDIKDFDKTGDSLAILLAISLLRNVTAYFRALIYPSEGENSRPVLLPSLGFLHSDTGAEGATEITWPDFDDSSLVIALSSAFNIWSSLVSAPSASNHSHLLRKVQEIFNGISLFFDEDDPLKFLAQFRTESFIYKGSFERALQLLDLIPQQPQIAQRILCLAVSGRINDSAKVILEDVLQRSNISVESQDADTGDLDLDAFSSSTGYFFTGVSPKVLALVVVSIISKSLESMWKQADPAKLSDALVVPSTLIVLSQSENWPLRASSAAEMVYWMFTHISAQGSYVETITEPADLVALPRVQALLNVFSKCIFRPELLEYIIQLVSKTSKGISKDVTEGAMEAEPTTSVASTVTNALLSQLSTVTVSAMPNPSWFAINYIKANAPAISSFINSSK